MNPFDIAIVVILGYGIILGILRGFIREIASIVGVLGGFYLAYAYYADFAKIFSPFIDTLYYRQIISFLAIFCAIAVGAGIGGMVLRTFLRLIFLGVVDRIFGALFGAAKAVAIIAVLHFLLITFLPGGGVTMVRNSQLAPAVNKVASVMLYIIPENAKETFVENMERLRWTWEKRQPPEPGKKTRSL